MLTDGTMLTEKISTGAQLQTFLLYNGIKACFEITWLHGTQTTIRHTTFHPLAESLQFCTQRVLAFQC